MLNQTFPNQDLMIRDPLDVVFRNASRAEAAESCGYCKFLSLGGRRQLRTLRFRSHGARKTS